MKKNFYLLIIISLFFIQKSYTQSQLVSLNNGYTHQSFFSFSNGEVSNVLNDNFETVDSSHMTYEEIQKGKFDLLCKFKRLDRSFVKPT